MVINDDVLTGKVSASTPLSTQIRIVFVVILKFKTLILQRIQFLFELIMALTPKLFL